MPLGRALHEANTAPHPLTGEPIGDGAEHGNRIPRRRDVVDTQQSRAALQRDASPTAGGGTGARKGLILFVAMVFLMILLARCGGDDEGEQRETEGTSGKSFAWSPRTKKALAPVCGLQQTSRYSKPWNRSQHTSYFSRRSATASSWSSAVSPLPPATLARPAPAYTGPMTRPALFCRVVRPLFFALSIPLLAAHAAAAGPERSTMMLSGSRPSGSFSPPDEKNLTPLSPKGLCDALITTPRLARWVRVR